MSFKLADANFPGRFCGSILAGQGFVGRTMLTGAMRNRIPAFIQSMNVRPTDRVLEIGCGHGVAATLICRVLTSGCYVGLDRSRVMIEVASTRNLEFVGQGKAEFLLGALETFDFGRRKFDKVVAMRVGLFHREPERARRLVESCLASGGEIFVQYDEP